MNLIEVLGIIGIDQRADRDQDITGANIPFRERVRLVVIATKGT